jgi:hypothetical protein
VQPLRQTIIGRRDALAQIEESCQTQAAAHNGAQFFVSHVPAGGAAYELGDARLISPNPRLSTWKNRMFGR